MEADPRPDLSNWKAEVSLGHRPCYLWCTYRPSSPLKRGCKGRAVTQKAYGGGLLFSYLDTACRGLLCFAK